jgi:hypothetical protein
LPTVTPGVRVMRKNTNPREGASVAKPSSKGSLRSARIFKTKGFARSAKRDGITDLELCRAAKDLQQGKGDDLGGNVWKKRLNQNRSRAIVATKPGAYWVFTYVFSKNDKENIDADELDAFKKLAKDFESMGVAGLEKLALVGAILEICNDGENGHKGKDHGETQDAQCGSHSPRNGGKTEKRGHGRHPRNRE